MSSLMMPKPCSTFSVVDNMTVILNDSRLLKPVAPTMLGSQKNKTGDRPGEKRFGLN